MEMESGTDEEGILTPTKKRKMHYDVKYSVDWEKKYSWITKSSKGNTFFNCKSCKADLKCSSGKRDLEKHEASVKHKKKLGRMHTFYMSTTRPFCFVCGKVESVGVFQLIEGCIVPGTFKPIKDILKYFEKVINQRLDLTPTSAACNDCLEYLFNYDRLVRNLSQVQRQIANSLLSCRKKKPTCLQPKKDAIKPKLTEVRSRFVETESPQKIVKPDADDDFMDMDEGRQESSFSECEESIDDSDGDDNLDIPCHICGELFSNQDCLERHIKKDNCQKNELATCNICGIKVKNDEVLDLHMNLHEGKTELECRYCPKKFSHKRNVLRHMEVHWDKKKYQCEKCGERFSLSWLMYNHLMRHDAEEHALICDVCHQQFKTKRTYKHHLRTHQTDRPRYQCPDCEKSFVDKYTLKVHKRVHMPPETAASATECHEINL